MNKLSLIKKNMANKKLLITFAKITATLRGIFECCPILQCFFTYLQKHFLMFKSFSKLSQSKTLSEKSSQAGFGFFSGDK